MSDPMRLEFTGDAFGQSCVKLDGIDITRHLRALTLFSAAREPNVVGLELNNITITVDAPVLIQEMAQRATKAPGDAVRAMNPKAIEEAAMGALGMGDADSAVDAILREIAKELDGGTKP